MIFLDNASTTRALDSVISSISDCMKNNYGNASSLHQMGINSEQVIRDAQSNVLKLLRASSGRVYFTSGGTESNNLAILKSINIKSMKNVATSRIEHSSVINCMKELERLGVNVKYLNVLKNFQVNDSELENFISEDTNFISIMHINNETGTILPLEKISKLRSKKCPKAIFHVDAVQSFGKIDINVKKLEIDLLSASAHKIHGPKGLGILYSSDRIKLSPLMFGGDQQYRIRPGTEPVELICGFNKSLLECDIKKRYEFVEKLNLYLRNKLSEIDNIVINSPINSSPYILNVSILGLKSEVLINFLSNHQICVSSSSACTGNFRSRVLSSANLPEEIIDSAIRISLSILNTYDDIDVFIKFLKKAKKELNI